MALGAAALRGQVQAEAAPVKPIVQVAPLGAAAAAARAWRRRCDVHHARTDREPNTGHCRARANPVDFHPVLSLRKVPRAPRQRQRAAREGRANRARGPHPADSTRAANIDSARRLRAFCARRHPRKRGMVPGGPRAGGRRVRRATTRQYTVTLVGLGAMGRRHARVLRSLPDRFNLVGAYDVCPDLPLPEGAVRLSSEAEAIARADIVVIATPIEAHASLVEQALSAGRHVLVEVLCATASEAYALLPTARGAGRLFVGHTERFNPVVRALARLIRRDPPLTIDLRRVGPSRPAGCGALMNLGVHDIDLAAYLGGGEVVIRSALPFGLSGAHEDFAAHYFFRRRRAQSATSSSIGIVPSKHRSISMLATRRAVYEGDLLAHRLVRTLRVEKGSNGGAAAPRRAARRTGAGARRCARRASGARDCLGADGARAVDSAEQAARQCARVGRSALPAGIGAPR